MSDDPVVGLLGLAADSLAWWQVVIRAVVVYASALVMVRLGEKRFLGKSTAFDVIIGVMLGSVVSRAITNPDAFVPGLVGGVTLVALHWASAWLAFRSDRFGTLIKGSPRTLVEDGAIRWDAMRQSHISRDDLLGALRAEGVEGPEDVREARLERSGKLSVLQRESPERPARGAPRIVEVRVADGVQHVRLELDG